MRKGWRKERTKMDATKHLLIQGSESGRSDSDDGDTYLGFCAGKVYSGPALDHSKDVQ